MKLSESKQRI